MLERIAIAPESSEPAVVRAIVDRARKRGFRAFVVSGGGTTDLPSDEVILRDGDTLHRGGASPSIRIVRVGDVAALERTVRETPDGGAVAIEWTADRVIPLESAVAHRGRRFQLWTFARTPAEVGAALGALEHGADRVVVTVRSEGDVEALERFAGVGLPSGLDWHPAPVTAVEPAGVGDRVIVDTTSLLSPEEGLVVGSAAGFLFHVASEAVGSAFSRARPFRVNAGAAHSYVLMSDGSTRYLSELVAGDSVLAVVPRGSARTVRVGRLKVERRPLVLVRAEDAGVARTVFLQEAETVRLSGDRGRVPVTELRSGATVLGVRLPPARHLGTPVEETIEER